MHLEKKERKVEKIETKVSLTEEKKYNKKEHSPEGELGGYQN